MPATITGRRLFLEESHGGVDGLSARARWLAGRGELRRGRPPDLHVHHLDVGGQEQGGQRSVTGGGHGVDQGLARGGRAGGREAGQPRGTQHGLGVEALVVGTDAVDGSAPDGGVAIDHQHLRSHATGRHGGVKPVGRGRTTTDDGHAQLSGGVGIALGHGDGVVLVPRSDELDAEAIERHREDCRVVAHESEHGADPQGMDVLGQDLEHRHDPTVVHVASFPSGAGVRHTSMEPAMAESIGRMRADFPIAIARRSV